jgi:hypothetical protein
MTRIVLIYYLELEQKVLHKSKQWPNICSYLKAQITYFQNEEVTNGPSANELELGMQMACQIGSAVMLQNNKKEKNSANELELGMQMARQIGSTVMLQNNKKEKK